MDVFKQRAVLRKPKHTTCRKLLSHKDKILLKIHIELSMSVKSTLLGLNGKTLINLQIRKE